MSKNCFLVKNPFRYYSTKANTTGTLVNKIDEVASNVKTANWKAINTHVSIYTKTKKKKKKSCF